MKTLEQLNQEIIALEEKIQNVKGRETEVYTRIVGYHRAVSNWNIGKKEEYFDRVTFKLNQKEALRKSAQSIHIEKENRTENTSSNEIVSYKLFWSNYCRNCPPVKEYMKSVLLKGELVDVSTEFGLSSAREYQVMSTPTVVFLDQNGKEVCKALDADQIKNILTVKTHLMAV